MSEKDKVVDVATHFRSLSSTAKSLNDASDSLTELVNVLDEKLKKLNLGVSTWYSYSWKDVEPPEYDGDQLGYAKINGKWGICLRRISGNESFDDRDHVEGPWLFGEGPRQMRIEAVGHLPKLIEELAKISAATVKSLEAKIDDVVKLIEFVDEIGESDQKVSK